MSQLIVRRVEPDLVRKLKAQAGLRGVSMEEEHRRILRAALLGDRAGGPSFKEFLLSMPEASPDDIFKRGSDKGRKIAI